MFAYLILLIIVYAIYWVMKELIDGACDSICDLIKFCKKYFKKNYIIVFFMEKIKKFININVVKKAIFILLGALFLTLLHYCLKYFDNNIFTVMSLIFYMIIHSKIVKKYFND